MADNKKNDVIRQLLAQFPELIINATYEGYVLNSNEDTVYTRITDHKGEEYDCELQKNLFPVEGLQENVCFLLILGEINQKEFKHINYFYWTQKDIAAAKDRANDLEQLLFNDNDIPN